MPSQAASFLSYDELFEGRTTGSPDAWAELTRSDCLSSMASFRRTEMIRAEPSRVSKLGGDLHRHLITSPGNRHCSVGVLDMILGSLRARISWLASTSGILNTSHKDGCAVPTRRRL